MGSRECKTRRAWATVLPAALAVVVSATVAQAIHTTCNDEPAPAGDPSVHVGLEDTYVNAAGFQVGADLNNLSGNRVDVCVDTPVTDLYDIRILKQDPNPSGTGATFTVDACIPPGTCSPILAQTGADQTRPTGVTTGPQAPVCVVICVNVPQPPYKVDTGYTVWVAGIPLPACVSVGTTC